jgi:hypothetical protein
MLLSKDAIPASDFFERLVTSRSKSRESGIFYVTSTIISPAAHISAKPATQPIQTISVSFNTPITKGRFNSIQTTLHLLNSISAYPNVDHYVIQQARGLLKRFSSCCIDPALSSAINDFDISIEYQLISLLSDYRRSLFEGRDTHQIAGDFAILVDHLTTALAQRISDLPSYRFGFPNLPEGYSNGIKTLAEAATKLVRFIYSQIDKSGIPGGEWSGFIIFSQYFNFGLQRDSIFSIPAQGLTQILTPTLNWLTITHEIAHTIWIRTGAYDTKMEAFEGNSIDDIVRGLPKKSQDGIITDFAVGQINPYDMLWEWFAHWYDFRHFYDSDIKLYLWAIWSSWLRLPVVRRDLRDYFVRSFVIYCLNDIEELRNAELKFNKQWLKDTLYKLYNTMLEELRTLSPVGFDEKEHMQGMQHRERAVRIVSYYIVILFIFENQFYNERLKSIFSSSNALTEELQLIKDGQPVSGCNNPLLLLRHTLDAVRQGTFTMSNKVQLALISSILMS